MRKPQPNQHLKISPCMRNVHNKCHHYNPTLFRHRFCVFGLWCFHMRKCQRELSLTNSLTCFWRSRGRAKRSTISMRSLLSSCKRMQSRKPSEEGIHLDCCLSSIYECLCRHIYTLWMSSLRPMGLCQRRW